jgi:hypothetical protein
VTLCIAATCEHDDDPRIVLCRDWRGEVPEVGSTDKQMKLRHLSKEWVALFAGDTARAIELCIRYEEHLKTVVLTQSNIAVEIRGVFQKYKRDLADSYMKTTYAISLDYLTDKEKYALGDQFRDTALDQISRLSVNVELLIAGFVPTHDFVDGVTDMNPIICAVSENHSGDLVMLEEDFAVIGAGSNAAKTMLYYRDQDYVTSLMETIYTVLEAKHLSNIVPGIGESYSVDVLHSDGTILTLSDAGDDRCEELFSRFGPRNKEIKTKGKWFEFKPEYLEPITEAAPAPSPPIPPQP